MDPGIELNQIDPESKSECSVIGIPCSHCGGDHWKTGCETYKDQMREDNIIRMKNIIEGGSFKRFGSDNEYCQCRIDMRVDSFLRETIPGVLVCYYCEWSRCSDCKLVGGKIDCDKHSGVN